MSAACESYTESYPAVPESVPGARSTLTQFAADAGARGERLEAIRLAASEAITNAAVHAYPDRALSGRDMVQVTASRVDDEVWILISDDGVGLRSHRGVTKGLGLGLVLIAQLADSFEIVNRGTGGTELRMRFRLRAAGPVGDSHPRGSVVIASAPA